MNETKELSEMSVDELLKELKFFNEGLEEAYKNLKASFRENHVEVFSRNASDLERLIDDIVKQLELNGRKYKNIQSASEAIMIEESSKLSGHYTMYDIKGRSYFDLESNDWNNWIMVKSQEVI